MNENQVSTYLPNKNTWKGISITKNAIKQILFLINLNPDNIGIRLSIRKSGCAGFRYTMKLVKNTEVKTKQEISFFYKNILIYILYKDMPFLEGVRIDFVKNNINKIFKFYNSKLEKFCGCGESFSIN
ncbi:Fe-S cluster assembly, scaffold protein [Buchnera aphidicola str. Ak (Acyrthosiphon kondoi)]|uniref:Fe-S cluster assembly, scaffold protein n=1 Tax=Buchnera aphidicola str. Ak (Acyrthosiphon kondoi) TaxID=1005090 RepID=G2LMJ5_9GAMM|nr:iron-sulfur cluster assembly accessory protein [Buchnera aphidicola]AEO08483.1 Fe-S cluster assembly, scaffold protein [Buchnera aphidicola str. Ak (Acyrthosiphon kondoi)]WAI18160.1 MAG: iron-sulfur cluster assembly accessory protein [Buchnera aphidicola (Acyrthosiphon caraganae)]